MLGERPTALKLIALVLALAVLALAGVALLVGVDPSATWEKVPAAGMSLAAAILFGLGTVLAKKHPLQLPPTASVAWQALLGMILVGTLAAFEHPDWGRSPSAGGWRSPASRRFR